MIVVRVIFAAAIPRLEIILDALRAIAPDLVVIVILAITRLVITIIWSSPILVNEPGGQCKLLK